MPYKSFPRRIVDISPPRQKEKEDLEKRDNFLSEGKKEKPKSHFPLVAKIIPGAFFVVFLVGIVIHFFFPVANIFIVLRTRIVDFEEEVEIIPDIKTIDKEKHAIPGEIVSEKVSATKFYPASGKKLQESKAQGVIRVFNNQSKPQILVANTRFISEDGKLFRSTERIDIPTGGYRDVQVIAAEAGEEYNIGPSNFSLPGLVGSPLYTAVYGKSFQPMTGGYKKEVPIVTPSDIENAKKQLSQDLLKSAREKLFSRVSKPFVMENNSIKEEITELESQVQAGAELTNFAIQGEVQVSALVFQQPQLQELILGLLLDKLTSGEKIDKETLTFSYSIKGSPSLTSLNLKLLGQARVFESQDENELRARLRGKNKNQALSILSSYENIARFKITLWPLWLTSLPQNPNRINFTISLD